MNINAINETDLAICEYLLKRVTDDPDAVSRLARILPLEFVSEEIRPIVAAFYAEKVDGGKALEEIIKDESVADFLGLVSARYYHPDTTPTEEAHNLARDAINAALKPCPFCGQKPGMKAAPVLNWIHIGDGDYCFIQDYYCCAATARVAVDEGREMAVVAKAWNDRVSPMTATLSLTAQKIRDTIGFIETRRIDADTRPELVEKLEKAAKDLDAARANY